MEELFGIGTAAAGGGLFGVVGSLAGRAFGYFETKQKLKARVAERDHELRLMDMQRQARAEETEQEIAVANAEGSWDGLRASHQSAASIGQSYRWVNAARSMVRVVMTPTLWVLAFAVLWLITHSDLRNYLSTEETFYLISYTVKSIIFSAATATTWWFGDRAPKPKGL